MNLSWRSAQGPADLDSLVKRARPLRGSVRNAGRQRCRIGTVLERGSNHPTPPIESLQARFMALNCERLTARPIAKITERRQRSDRRPRYSALLKSSS